MRRATRLLSLLTLSCGAMCGTAFAEDLSIEGGVQLRQDALVVPAAEPGAIDTRLRWWLRKGRADFGFGLRSDHGMDPMRPQQQGWRPTVSVGWQAGAGHATLYADANGLTPGREVGVEWTPAKQLPMGLRDGLLGVRLDSGYRVSLKPRKGGLAVYMRGQF